MTTAMHNMVASLFHQAGNTETDGQLLSRFIAAQDESSFAELMRRHGPMVFASARRLLGSATDAEDVYQATFLLLARKASRLCQERSLAGWLYGVTRKLAADLRKQQRRREKREESVSLSRQESATSSSLLDSQEALRLLDAELSRLAPALREPLVLHCLEGLSHQQVADRLGMAMGTVASRMHRAKQLLKNRLLQRGVSLASILALYSGVAQARLVPTSLGSAAIQAALNKTSIASLVSSGAATLFTGELRMVWLKQLQLAAAACIVGGFTLFAAGSSPVAQPIPTLAIATSRAASTTAPQLGDDLARLQGTWHAIAIIPGGKNPPSADELNSMREFQLVIQGETVTTKNVPNGEKTSKLKLDSTTSPKRMELVNKQDVELKALYSLENDVLIMTFEEGGDKFPPSLAVTQELHGAMIVLQKTPFPLAKQAGKQAAQTPASGKELVHSNMKQLGLAFHNYLSDHNKFPRNIVDVNGKALLSWRVALLPYLQQDALYRQFKLDEPWDSDHNKQLIRYMPKVLAIDASTEKQFTTVFLAFMGNGAAFEFNKDVSIADVVDGLSNTIMFVEADKPVTWTKPEDYDFLPNQPLPKLGTRFDRQFQVAMLDGSVRSLPMNIKEEVLKGLITRANGEVFLLEDAPVKSKSRKK